MKEKDLTSDPKQRLWIMSFAVAALLIVALGYTHYRANEDHVFSERARDLAAIGSLKAEQISEWRRERLADAIRFAQGPTLTRAISKSDETDLRTMLVLNRKGSFYEDSLLVSPTGAILKSASETPIPTSSATKRAIGIALATRAPTLSDFFASENGAVHIDIAAPVCEDNGRPTAVFILRCNAEDFLYPMLRSWPVTSASAETLLVRRDGKEVVVLNMPHHSLDPATKLRIPLSRTTSPAVQAALGKLGLFRGRSYHDKDVLADLRPIPNSDWFMVAQVDRDEILEEIRTSAAMTVRVVVLGILLVGTLAAFGYRRQQAHVYRNLYSVEREQRAATEKFRAILYSIGDAVITSDEKGCVLQMNEVAEQLTGWRENEAAGRPLDEVFRIVTEETHAPMKTPVWRVLNEGQKVVGMANHTLLLSRDGTERAIADSGAPIRDENGQLTGAVLIFRDQTAERSAQQALAESERRLSTLMNNLPGMAYRCDFDTYWTMRFVSEGCQALTGYGPDDLVENARIAYADLIHPDDRQGVWEKITEAVKARQPFTLEYRIHTADWAEKWIWERGCAILRPDGTVEAIEGFITDISERKQASAEQAKLEGQLHQAQKIEAVGRLAGGIAHDFNNMLGIIIGNVQLAMERLGNNNPVHSELIEIMTASSHSAELVKQLLAFASKQTISPRHLNLNETITGMTTMLQKLCGEEIALEWRPGDSLWPVLLDPGQLDQALVNLTLNARDSISGGGRITIETRNESYIRPSSGAPEGAESGDYVALAVSDTGCGMDAMTQTRVFEPFFSTKQNIGTGLGLPTVYGIVKQNKGFIVLDSKPGNGTRFTLYLPRLVAPPPPPPPRPAPDGQRGHVAENVTVLLVEDEPGLLTLTHALLKKVGYKVLPANSPAEAIALAETSASAIDLLVTDVVMPGMSGRELWQQLIRQRPDLKVLFMSGYTADIIANRGVIEDELHFIQKPFTVEGLAAKISETLAAPQTSQPNKAKA